MSLHLTTAPTESRELRRCSAGAKAPRLRTLRAFAESEIVIPDGPFEGRRFRCERQPFSGLLLDCLEDPRWSRKFVTGPSQSGKTLGAFVAPTLWHLFEWNETVIVGLPSLDMASDKWKEDIQPAIQASRYRDLLPKRGAGSRSGTPTSIKFGNGATLRFMTGGGGDKVRAGFTSRVVVVTEVDGLDEVGGTSRETDKVRQLEARTRAYGDRSRFYGECTVSTSTGRTWREYTGGTETRIVVPCPHCEAWTSPEREDLKGWQSAASELDAERSAYFACPECDSRWSDAERVAINDRARVVHQGQEIDPDGNIHGVAPDVRTLGFRWSAFHNLFMTPGQLGAEEWSAEHADDLNAEVAQKQFVWCIPVVDDSVETRELTSGIVRGSHPDYVGRVNGMDRGIVPDNCKVLTITVDVQKGGVYVLVCAWHNDKKRQIVDWYCWGDGLRLKHHADGRRANRTGVEEAVRANLSELRDDLTANPYCCSGEAVQPNVILVDSGFETKTVHECVLEFGSPWHAARGIGDGKYRHPGKTSKHGDKRPSVSGDLWHKSQQTLRRGVTLWQINMNADWWKHRCHDSWTIRPLNKDGERPDGCVTLWGDDPREHTGFAEQITAEEWREEFKEKKGVVAEFVKIRRDNHALDCDYMTLVAGSMCGVWQHAHKPKPPPPKRDRNSQPEPMTTPDGRAFLITER